MHLRREAVFPSPKQLYDRVTRIKEGAPVIGVFNGFADRDLVDDWKVRPLTTPLEPLKAFRITSKVATFIEELGLIRNMRYELLAPVRNDALRATILEEIPDQSKKMMIGLSARTGTFAGVCMRVYGVDPSGDNERYRSIGLLDHGWKASRIAWSDGLRLTLAPDLGLTHQEGDTEGFTMIEILHRFRRELEDHYRRIPSEERIRWVTHKSLVLKAAGRMKDAFERAAHLFSDR